MRSGGGGFPVSPSLLNFCSHEFTLILKLHSCAMVTFHKTDPSPQPPPPLTTLYITTLLANTIISNISVVQTMNT